MSITVSLSGSKAVIAVTGRFVFDVHSEFRAATRRVLDHVDIREIEIDLAKAEYLDSAGLGMLLLLHERAKNAHKQPIRITGSNGRVRNVLQMCNFDRLFGIS